MYCQQVVSSVNNTTQNQFESGVIISQFILQFLPNYQFYFVRRQTNVTAHYLVRVANSYVDPHICVDLPMVVAE